jgi:hypothetical protein
MKSKKINSTQSSDKKVTIKDVQPIKTIVKGYEIIKQSKLYSSGFRSVYQLKQWYIAKYHQDERMLINMELRNGDHTSFIIRTKSSSFTFKSGEYVLDNELKYYHIDSSMYGLDYHQDFALPIKRIIPLNDIGKAVSLSGLSNIEYSTNPSVLSKFVTSKISEGIMKGQMIDEYLKQMKLILVITMVSSLLMLLLFVLKSGMLKGIRIPGIM